ncbi:universal stress protein [Pontibaca salina]|uniref:Universal stress protein n=1 Tax=Pontibaca salina TaxID=2795731 RepID=A0A934HLU4_9RHOB|nr:universal stress protein [Pontibaca salina]MBI6630589.1 universal stress protein [Pontibaca salina]
MIRNLFRRSRKTDNGEPVRHILIASEGRRISNDVIDLAVDMLHDHGGHATVLTVARLWGTSFGLPNPGLRPSKREMDEQKDNMFQALDRLNAAGIEAGGHIVTTRHPLKSIRKQALEKNCDAIIMGADRRQPWFLRNFMWSQEPYRIRARVPLPVYLVCPAATPSGSAPRRRRPRRISVAKQ